MPASKAFLRDEQLRADAAPYDWSKSRLTDEEVKEFALGMYRQEIFTELHIAPHDRTNGGVVRMVFMGLALAASEMDPEIQGALDKSPPGMVYARYHVNGRSNTFPRSINGYPIFNACAFLSREDTDRVQDKYEEIEKALEGA
jgi:hypothetical protein